MCLQDIKYYSYLKSNISFKINHSKLNTIKRLNLKNFNLFNLKMAETITNYNKNALPCRSVLRTGETLQLKSSDQGSTTRNQACKTWSTQSPAQQQQGGLQYPLQGQLPQACIRYNNNNNNKNVNGVNFDLVPNLNSIQDTLHELSIAAIKSDITITDSSNVHLGHKINYNGNLFLNIVNNNDESENYHHSNNNVAFIKTVSNVRIANSSIIRRCVWSIREPVEKYDTIKEPVKLVIISHTATTSSTSQSKNIQLVRDIQAFHIDTHNWNDIGYNFLIGCDGTIYEGRGWGIEGAHTFGYNNLSIGVSFIGCFINRKPTDEALNACKKLLKKGVYKSHLAKNYKLLGHRQCTETESPGTKLYEEIIKWDHFFNKSFDEDYING